MRTSIMVDLPIVHFRNSWHNSFLEKCNLHCLMASSGISLDMCIK